MKGDVRRDLIYSHKWLVNTVPAVQELSKQTPEINSTNIKCS